MPLVISVMLTSFQLQAQAQGKELPVEHQTFYRTAQTDKLSIFYREAGPKGAPTLLWSANTSSGQESGSGNMP
jgi:hypothetical protein